jgi:hypothetical protein
VIDIILDSIFMVAFGAYIIIIDYKANKKIKNGGSEYYDNSTHL